MIRKLLECTQQQTECQLQICLELSGEVDEVRENKFLGTSDKILLFQTSKSIK